MVLRIHPTESGVRWLTIAEASNLLGIAVNTLRVWADAGHVRSFRTAGGHRRFSEDDLRSLQEHHGEAIATQDTPERAVIRMRRRLDSGARAGADWSRLLSEDERNEVRLMGRRLVELGTAYVAQPRRRPRFLSEGRQLGRRYGAIMAGHGMTLSQALETFLFFRNLFSEAAGAEASPSDGHAAGRYHQRSLTAFMDQVMLGTARAFDEPMAGTGG